MPSRYPLPVPDPDDYAHPDADVHDETLGYAQRFPTARAGDEAREHSAVCCLPDADVRNEPARCPFYAVDGRTVLDCVLPYGHTGSHDPGRLP